jgi:chromosome segregation ATPase
LNGYWGDGVNGEEANKVWDFVRHFVQLDLLGPTRKGEEGNELDQFWSAKFLEDKDSAMPAMQRKEALRSIDQDSNGKMSAIEYLVWKYKKGVQETAEAPQGDNTEAIKKAQEALQRVSAQLAECERKLEAQKTAKEENDKAIGELKKAEQELKQAESELEAAISELKKQEDEYKSKCETLESKSKDQSITVVQRNKAANELAQLKGEDPLPIRKAKITQEAALRKVQKQKKATEEAKLVQEAKGRDLEKAIRDLEAAYVTLEQKMVEAQAELEKIKSKPGGGKGAIWWMQRELFEIDNRLPKSKQKFDHAKPFFFSP